MRRSTPILIGIVAFVAALAPQCDAEVKAADVDRLFKGQLRMADGARKTYRSNADIEMEMAALVAAMPKYFANYTVGKSVRGTTINALMVADNPTEKVDLRPEVLLMGNVHGNEVVGRELIMNLAQFIKTNIETENSLMLHFLTAARLHLLPTLNPDGFEKANEQCNGPEGSANYNGQDLNTDYPDLNGKNDLPHQQPETEAFLSLLTKYRFVISGNFLGNELVVTYPWNNNKESKVRYTPTEDDDVFRYVATDYAMLNKDISSNSNFDGGIVNGASNKLTNDSMQDWIYGRGGGMQLALGVTDCNYPSDYSEIDALFDNNVQSMMWLMFKGLLGIRGTVQNLKGEPIVGAEIFVDGRTSFKTYTTDCGEFTRILLRGNYTVHARAPDCAFVKISAKVPEPKGKYDVEAWTRIDFKLNCEKKETPSPNKASSFGAQANLLWIFAAVWFAAFRSRL